MTATSRQTDLILNQDWTRIYQTFKNADFKSYDFENLRRVIISYLRENYPEDFNDYIESSEYLALIDAVAFLGQSLAFRIDLNSRENFIDLAARKDSVLRLARMLSYNAKRNIAASGLLKITSISTTEDVFDSNGINIGRQTILWDDPTNSDWYEHFILVLNATMVDNLEFGRSERSRKIQNINTDQYRFRSNNTGVPVYSFSKAVANQRMTFEVVSTVFNDSEEIYEEDPVDGTFTGFVYRNDGRGPSSPNTGFFMMFKQGSLEQIDFNIETPMPNERVFVNTANINNDDVWLFSVNSAGSVQNKWTKVPSLTGNNIAYNSIFEGIRNVFFAETRVNDTIELVFPDGVFGNLPKGDFRLFARISNGLEYVIRPNEMQNIFVPIEYAADSGTLHSMRIGLSLQTTVSNAAATESIDAIRFNAPAQYYTQDRMITAEDYNLAPLTSSQNIIKVKAVNRVSSGISRNFDLIDSSGKYSDITVFADDGYIYQQQNENFLNLRFISRTDLVDFINTSVEPIFTDQATYNLFLNKFPRKSSFASTVSWQTVTEEESNLSTGFLTVSNSPVPVGAGVADDLKFVETGAMLKFIPASGEYTPAQSSMPDRLWVKVIKVVGDGSTLTNDLGGIFVNNEIPEGSILSEIVPKFVNNLPTALENTIINNMQANLTFAIRYNADLRSWRIISENNIDFDSEFSLTNTGDTSGSNADASWFVLFKSVTEGEYTVTYRGLQYIFGSVRQNRFFFDTSEKQFNDQLGLVTPDLVKILSVNPCTIGTPLPFDTNFIIGDVVKLADGYASNYEVVLQFNDSDADGIIDNPDSFSLFVTNQCTIALKQHIDSNRNIVYYLDSTVNPADVINNPLYKVVNGKSNIKFQYVHNAAVERRIDPSASNIIDLFLMTRAYNSQFRQYLAGIAPMPEVPTTEDLRVEFGSKLSAVKAISDEIIYRPVKYRILFGSTAEPKLRAVFKVVKNPERSVDIGDLKVRIINAFDRFFDLSNWNFGDRFYISELITYVIAETAPDVTNIAIIPRDPSQSFGSLFEIQSRSDEIFISGATVDDIEIVQSINATEVRAPINTIISAT